MKDWLIQHIIEAWLVLIGGVATYFARRWVQTNEERHAEHEKCYDAHEERIRQIEVAHVTRKDFDELRRSMVETYANGQLRLETLMLQMHAENRDTALSTQKRVDALWERRAMPRGAE